VVRCRTDHNKARLQTPERVCASVRLRSPRHRDVTVSVPLANMADFDTIYELEDEDDDDEERVGSEEAVLCRYCPEPVVVRGAGHITV